jgi:RimJ/RimL family protein N-acetyltransferase
MTQNYPFQAEHVFLRAFEPEDVPALYAYLNHPELAGRRYISWRFPSELPLPKGKVESVLEKWQEDEKAFHLAVILRPEGELIGHASCDWGWDPHCPGVELVIDPEYQRLGYGGEVLELLLQYLFGNTAAHNVSIWIADWNQGGLAFAQRHGFREAGRMRRAGFRGGEYFDVVVMDLLRPEWEVRGGGDNDA